MRCISCNSILTEYETTRKYTGTTNFLDLCINCSSFVSEVELDDRRDLATFIIDDTVDGDIEWLE